MVATSQNGWPIVGRDQIDNTPINGHKYPNGFLKGDVYEAFKWLFTQLDARVEKVARGNPPDEWGYYVKLIEGSTSSSNHGSGTAGDYNATLHPMGTRNTYNPTQRAEIQKILLEAKGIFRWGGNYTGRPDDMHFEIVKSPTAVASFVNSIRPQGSYKMTVNLNGLALPKLAFGNDDSKRSGWNYVGRAQAMLNFVLGEDLKTDGYYGKLTKEAVVRLNSDSDGTSIGLPEWTQLYGLGRI